MNNYQLKIVLIIISLFFFSCSTSFTLKPIIDSEMLEMVFVDGREVVISTGRKTVIAIFGTKTTKNELLLHIFYQNNTTDEKINVIPEKISVYGYSSDGIVQPFKVYSANEYLKKMRNTQAWAMAFKSFAGAVEASRAGKKTTYTSGRTSGSIIGDDGSYYSGSASTYETTTTYDYAAEVEANARNRVEMQKTAEKFSQLNAVTKQGLLKANTLFPRQNVEGNIMVKMDPLYSSKFVVTIIVGDELHIIKFVPRK